MSCIALGVCLLGSVPLLGQDGPRTASGKPDFSGTYDIATLTPLSRPKEFGDRLFLTEEEATALASEEQANLDLGRQVSDPDRAAPAVGGSAPVGLDESFREISGAGGVGGYNNFWIDRGDGAFAVDGRFRTSIIEDPKSGQLPSWTMAGGMRIRKLFASFTRPNDGTAWWAEQKGPGPYDDPESLMLADRCLLGFGSTAGPPMLPVLYNNLKRIVQTENHLMILNEMVHDTRIIRIDSEHNPSDLREWLGDSIAHWEGDTLVVESRNFRDETAMFAASRNLHVTERFSRLDGKSLLYEFTVNDPDTWQKPWTGSYPWPATEDKVYEYACHEGNYAMGGILRGARLLEDEAQKDTAKESTSD